MTFNNQLLVTFNDKTWVICRFIKSLGFMPYNPAISFSSKPLFAQHFILEGVINSLGERSNKEICGNEIKSIIPIHNVPLLITLKHEGLFYERIKGDLYVHDGISNRISNRFSSYYEHGEDYYSNLINSGGELQLGSIYDNMIRPINDDCPSHVYSIEPFLTANRVVDYVAMNERGRQFSNADSLFGDQNVSEIDLIVDTCHKTVRINTVVERSYSTRNFDVDEKHNLTYVRSFPTRKICQDFLNEKLKRINRITNSEIIETTEAPDIIKYTVVFPEGVWLSEALEMSAEKFTDNISSNSTWNW